MIITPSAATIPKDHRKLAASATKPTNGGISKKPKYPIVDMEANAVPLLIFVDRPAIWKTVGTIHDTPNPTNIKPNPAVMG